MVVLGMTVRLHIRAAQSLKEKRGVVRPLVEGIRGRFAVSVAEVDHQDTWQRCDLGVALVSGNATAVEELADKIERFVWSFPELDVLSIERRWMEFD